METTKFLTVCVYRSGNLDSTNGGTSSFNERLAVPCENGNLTEQDVRKLGMPIMYLCENSVKKFLRPEGVSNGAFGGNFAWSSDSRFRRNISEYPVAIHDRVE